jgi:hypothetical protein
LVQPLLDLDDRPGLVACSDTGAVIDTQQFIGIVSA